MIKLWLARRSSIAIREQLSAQFILGIVSRKLAPGERLPSVRELGRRLHLHSNTISATYRDLAKRGWVSNRRGSGVFVRKAPILDQNNSLDAFVATCIEDGLARGFPLDALRVAFGNISHASRQAELLVVDPDPELARVLAVEIGGAIGTHVPYSGYDGVSEKLRANTCVLSIEAHLPRTAKLLPGSIIRPIHLKSMQEMLIGQQRPPAAVLIAVASRSASILRWASTLIAALGFSVDAVLLRDAGVAHWQDGLGACDIVAADKVTAAELSRDLRPIVFSLVAEEFLAEMRQLVTA